MRSVAGAVVLLLLLTGCAPKTWVKFNDSAYAGQPAPVDRARIFLLRPFQHFVGSRWAPIEIDGTRVGEVAAGAFFVVDTSSGEHEISTSVWDIPGRFAIKVDLQAGETYYVEVSPRTENMMYMPLIAFGAVGGLAATALMSGGMFQLLPIDPQDALKKLPELELAQ